MDKVNYWDKMLNHMHSANIIKFTVWKPNGDKKSRNRNREILIESKKKKKLTRLADYNDWIELDTVLSEMK